MTCFWAQPESAAAMLATVIRMDRWIFMVAGTPSSGIADAAILCLEQVGKAIGMQPIH
jgi:hypothetical protein